MTTPPLNRPLPDERSPPQEREPAAATAAVDVWAVFGRAVALHQAGRLSEAEPLYQEVLRHQPQHFDCLHLLGVVHCQRGEPEDAVREIGAALKINPNVAAAHNNLGNAFKALGRRQEAIESYARAIALQPDYAEAFYNRANVLRESNRFSEAVEDYDRAVALRPNYAEALNSRGNALKAQRRLEDALASYDRAIVIKPDYADAWYNRGKALHELRRLEEAVASCDKAIALRPDLAEAYNNRGNSLKDLRRFEEAVESYHQAVALKPDYADAFINLGNALKDLRRFDDALSAYDHAIALQRDHADAYHNKAVALLATKQTEQALASLDRAIALKPDHAEAFFVRGAALLGGQGHEEAMASFGRALALKSDIDHLKGIYLYAKMQICDWTNVEAETAELRAAVAHGIEATYPFQLLICDSSPAEQLACARTYVDSKCPPYPEPIWRGERYRHKRIRVAYVSADFRQHPVSYQAAGLFARHDRSRFETIGISLVADHSSPMRERVRASCDRFFDVDTIDDRQAAKLVRDLEIDIAVDLNGFTDDSRPNIFAQKPAPVQVNYLGYAGTLGQDYCDYIIADRFVIPEQFQKDYAEKVVYLPDCFMASDSGRAISARTPSRAEAGLPEQGFVFCCFNNSFKITPSVFDVWMRLLKEIDDSVLWLSTTLGSRNLRAEAEKRGVAAERLLFAPRVPFNEDHLARIRCADLFLDTFYYNAHSTAADALWAGLPVLTCSGAAFASRVAGSLLHAVGLPELVTTSIADYEALALRLARDPPGLLSALREKLARNRAALPLFDTERFTRHIEAAYTTMWERTQRGEAPASFAVGRAD